MKTLTKFAVETTMNLLIHSNGETTTLDVKNHLRGLNYFAKQDEVSLMMREIILENTELYNVESGNYNVYSWDKDGDLFFNFNLAQEYSDTNDNIITEVVTVSIDLREPIFICHTDYDIESRKNKNEITDNNWIVFCTDDNEPILVFNEYLNRDTVRSRYASINKVSIQDVRAKRTKNYKS